MDPEHLKDALKLARRHGRPFLTRTHTKGELVAAARRRWGCLLEGPAMALLLLPLWMAIDGEMALALEAAPFLALAALGLWLLARRMKSRVGMRHGSESRDVGPVASGAGRPVSALSRPAPASLRAGDADLGLSDPGIVIEVRDDRLIIAMDSDRHLHELSYEEVSGRIGHVLAKGLMFRGVTIDLPIRPVAIDDLHMEGGRIAAALIVERCVACGAMTGPE